MRHKQTREEWLGRNVVKGDPDECWMWKGEVDGDGRGTFRLGRQSANIFAHRVAYELWVRPIPPPHPNLGTHGWCVCHICDVPRCCNPGHLFLAPQRVNIRDAATKGRLSSKSKVSDATVSEMRALYATGCDQRSIATKFGLSQPYVSRILRGDRRLHPLITQHIDGAWVAPVRVSHSPPA